MSLVTSVTHVNQASLIIHHVKKVVQIDQAYTFSSQLYVLISDCKCNPVGSTTLECGKVNGECSCKETFTGIKCDQCIPNVIGDKCDACEPSFFNYPLCEGLSKLTIFNHSINFLLFRLHVWSWRFYFFVMWHLGLVYLQRWLWSWLWNKMWTAHYYWIHPPNIIRW